MTNPCHGDAAVAARVPAREWLLLGTLAALWGSSYLFIRIAVETIPPVTLIAIRVTLAAALLSGIALARGEAFPRGWAVWSSLFVQSLCNSIGAWTLLAWGQQRVPSGVAGVLNSTSPLFVVGLTLLAGSVRPRWIAVAGALTGFAGVATIVGADAPTLFGGDLAGQLAVLASAALYACAALNGRRFASLPPAVTAAATMLLASAALVPASLALDRPWTLSPSTPSLLAALTLAIACTGFALLLYFRLLRTIGALGVASNSYLRAGVSVALGVAVLGESLSWPIAAGGAAIVAGVVLINAPARAPAAASTGARAPGR
jgi:drug/metabolite transporter (DMT)-like permease